MSKPIRQTPTKSQKKNLSYLAAEKKRQKDSFEELSQYPLFMMNCCGCFQELKTSHVDAARDFIMQHAGHKAFSFEVNVRPESIAFDRELVLNQLKELGLYLVDHCAKDGIVVKETRNTWLTIKNGIDIEGALNRLKAVYVHKDNYDQCLADSFVEFWLQAILNQDLTFLTRIVNWRTRDLSKENK